MPRSPFTCDHANECPTGLCRCREDCACREVMCQTTFDVSDVRAEGETAVLRRASSALGRLREALHQTAQERDVAQAHLLEERRKCEGEVRAHTDTDRRLTDLLEEHRGLLRRNLELRRTVQSIAVAAERAAVKLLSWEPIVTAAVSVARYSPGIPPTSVEIRALREALNEAAKAEVSNREVPS